MDDIYEIDTDFSSHTRHKKNSSNTWNPKTFSIVAAGFFGIFFVGVMYVLNVNNSSYKNPSYDSRSFAKIQPTPLPLAELIGASVSGTLKCIKTNESCDPILETTDGQISLIGNEAENIKKIPTGTVLTLYGVTPTISVNLAGKGKPKSSLIVINPTKLSSASYPLISLTPVPSITPTATLTITPTPTIVDPPNIKEIVDASPGNDGDTLIVIGYIVNATIGEEACTYLNQCDFSTFVVNEDMGIDRDKHYDVMVKASKDEVESDYMLNGKVRFNAKVVVQNGLPTLEKLY